MAKNLDKALSDVDILYKDLIKIANGFTEPYFKDCNAIIKTVQENIESLSNSDIQTFMLKLSTCAFSLSEVKDKAAMRAECAETLRKEAYSVSFNGYSGSVAVRENNATISVSEEVVVNVVFDLVANQFKTKLDELHRVVDTLKTVLMSRLSEAKLSQTTTIGDVGERTYITE